MNNDDSVPPVQLTGDDDDAIELVWRNSRVHLHRLRAAVNPAAEDFHTSESPVRRNDDLHNSTSASGERHAGAGSTASDSPPIGQPPAITGGSTHHQSNSTSSDSTASGQSPDRKRKDVWVNSTEGNLHNNASTSTKRSRISNTSDDSLSLVGAIGYLQSRVRPTNSNVIPTMVPGFQHPSTPNSREMSMNTPLSRPTMPYQNMNMAMSRARLPYPYMNMALGRPLALNRPLMAYQSVLPNAAMATPVHAPQFVPQYHAQGFPVQSRPQGQNTNRPQGQYVPHPYQHYPGHYPGHQQMQQPPPPPPGSNPG